jgi:hypothetical protein
MSCPLGLPDKLKDCECCPYSKDRLCDYPYYADASAEEIKTISETLRNRDDR